MSLPTKDHYDVAIIGAGFCGSMVAVHLARLAPRWRVLVVDKEGAFGRGVAYGAGSSHHVLNVSAGKISAFADQPDHFVHWLEDHRAEISNLVCPDLSPGAFLPRRLYGYYLQDLFRQAQQAAPGLETATLEIVDIEPKGPHLVLSGPNGRHFTAGKAVLALGNFAPGDPPTKDRRFHRSARYLSSPWPPAALQQIGPEEEVLILGAGLTALDLLVSLEAKQHRGRIHVVSRHGLFPQPHQPHTAQPEWFRDRELPRTIRELLRLVRHEVRMAAAEGVDWRAVIDALRPRSQQLWRGLNLQERRRFMRHVRAFWESHRHRVPPATLAVKDQMLQRGQLLAHQARVLSITETARGMTVRLVDRTRQSETELRVAFVLNCTGPECNYYKLKDPLVVNLLARGLIHPDPLFLGLMATPDGALLNYLGQPSEGLFTLGSVKKGMVYETTAVAELRLQARDLAERLVQPARPLALRAPKRADPAEGQIVLISNRGPNDFVWQEERWVPRAASGGLVSMIDPLAREPDVTWFCCVSEPPAANEARGALLTTAADQSDPQHRLVPVPLPARIYQAYYGAISNEVLWMLQHHLVGQFGYSSLDAARHRAWHEGYLEANRRMVVALRASGIQPRAFLIQDYHFYALPALLRQAFPDIPSLHFTHIPFPDAATLKLIPQHWRDTLLKGVLGADVVGMQTVWDARPFLGCCEELLGLKVDYGKGTVQAPDGRVVRVCAFPASIDPAEVRRTLGSRSVAHARERLGPHLDRATIIRVDRLDPSKNQIIGFQAFGRLLELRPELRGNVRFLAFLVPSRTDLSVYREYRDAVYATIQEVNRRFGPDCGFDPIQVFYTNDREQALAAMEQCDVLLANSR
ncbi:MAG TPA: FAD-dependent oxidoreductase, partial [Candidatus Sulfotelmatobacter sp.]|nr:FAD-dependent oxidoreductase [Candidatus Sulfotelmatobacter sp.]